MSPREAELLTSRINRRLQVAQDEGGGRIRSVGGESTVVGFRRGPWRTIDAVEFATLEWVAWYNNRRLLEPIGYVPPVEHEEAYFSRQHTPAVLAGVTD